MPNDLPHITPIRPLQTYGAKSSERPRSPGENADSSSPTIPRDLFLSSQPDPLQPEQSQPTSPVTSRYPSQSETAQHSRPDHPYSLPNSLLDQWQEPRDRSSALSGYTADSSRPSTILGSEAATESISEFPDIPNPTSSSPYTSTTTIPRALLQKPSQQQQGPPQSRRSSGPGRRGVSSYYSQSPFVPPIPEEPFTSRNTRTSFASSHVMPESWGNGPPQYYMGHGLHSPIGEEESEDLDAHSSDSDSCPSKADDFTDQSNLVNSTKMPAARSLKPKMDPTDSKDRSAMSRSPSDMYSPTLPTQHHLKELRSQSRSSSVQDHGEPEQQRQTTQQQAFLDAPNSHHPQTRPNVHARTNTYSGYESDATFLESRSTSIAVPRVNPAPTDRSSPFATPHTYGSPNINIEPTMTPMSGRGPAGNPGPDLDPRRPSDHQYPVPAHLAANGRSSPRQGNFPPQFHQPPRSPQSGDRQFSKGHHPPRRPPSVLEREKGARRPPPLNLTEARPQPPGRNSSSSLPDLIRRATKLASNLDRGKTASGAGLLDILNKKELEKLENPGPEKSRNGSLSDMLAAFPSPSPTPTPTGEAHTPRWGGTNGGSTSVSSPHGKSMLSSSHTNAYSSARSDIDDQGRRVCGLPLWAVILVIIIMLLLVAAAIVIPVTLIVVPKSNKSPATLASCRASNPCENGGTSILLHSNCRCICANGWTGSSCTQQPDARCTTTDISRGGPTTNTYLNSTVGDTLPRIMNSASTNYSIPLSPAIIVSLFSYTNLSCASENALIALSGNNAGSLSRLVRRSPLTNAKSLTQVLSENLHRNIKGLQRSLRSSLLDPNILSQRVLSPPPTKTIAARASAQSSNGIVFAAGTLPSGSGTSSSSGTTPSDTPLVNMDGASSPDPSSSSSSSSSSSGSSSGSTNIADAKPIYTTTIDFARTAILFIFQETEGDLRQTTEALTRLQNLLGPGVGHNFDSSQSSMGGNITIDLVGLSIGFGNGTLYGGKGSS